MLLVLTDGLLAEHLDCELLLIRQTRALVDRGEGTVAQLAPHLVLLLEVPLNRHHLELLEPHQHLVLVLAVQQELILIYLSYFK